MSKMKEHGMQAFPINGLPCDFQQEGMTLRDYFAAKAMQSLIASPFIDQVVAEEGWSDSIEQDVCDQAYALADAMLAARKYNND